MLGDEAVVGVVLAPEGVLFLSTVRLLRVGSARGQQRVVIQEALGLFKYPFRPVLALGLHATRCPLPHWRTGLRARGPNWP